MTLIASACAVAAEVSDDGGGDGSTGGDGSVETGPTSCTGKPVDTQTDPQNCGTCGHVCPTGATCAKGTCQCPNGAIDCNGACTNTGTDINHCGTCNSACGGSTDAGLQGGGAWACEAGSCVVDCTGSLSACAPTGCFDLTKDDNHCGTCTTACTGQTCCSSNCTDTTSDNTNCGNCGTKCTTTQTCSTGHCCTTGDSWCTTACTNTNTDVKNCGSCGNACDAGYCDGGGCCNKPTTGTCLHSPCTAGAKGLKSGCSPCVTQVCAVDSYCCVTAWDSVCVGEVATYCTGESCSC